MLAFLLPPGPLTVWKPGGSDAMRALDRPGCSDERLATGLKPSFKRTISDFRKVYPRSVANHPFTVIQLDPLQTQQMAHRLSVHQDSHEKRDLLVSILASAQDLRTRLLASMPVSS